MLQGRSQGLGPTPGRSHFYWGQLGPNKNSKYFNAYSLYFTLI